MSIGDDDIRGKPLGIQVFTGEEIGSRAKRYSRSQKTLAARATLLCDFEVLYLGGDVSGRAMHLADRPDVAAHVAAVVIYRGVLTAEREMVADRPTRRAKAELHFGDPPKRNCLG